MQGELWAVQPWCSAPWRLAERRKIYMRKGMKIYMNVLRMCTNIHSDFLSMGFFHHNVALCYWNTNKRKISAGWAITIPWVFGDVTLHFPSKHPPPAASTLLAARLTCPCVPSTRCPHHQGRGLHSVLGHGHRPLVCRLGISRVLHRGVLPTALAGRRGSQVSAQLD